MRLLARRDCDLNVRDKDGDTALSHACCAGHSDVVTVLLSSPLANVNTSDTDLVTPLHKAIANNHIEIVRILLKEPQLEVCFGSCC